MNTASTTGANGTAGLVGYWSFNNQDMNWTSATAGTAKDRSGYNNTGTLTGMNRATSPAQGKIGQGLNFSGIGSCVTVKDNNVFNSNAAMSWSFWIYDKQYTTNMDIFDKGSQGGPAVSTWAMWQGANLINLRVINSVGTYDQVSATISNVNQWNHVTFVYDSSYINAYVNGVYKTRQPLAGPMATSTNPVTIGCSKWGANDALSGLYDEVRIYNRALSASEVKQLYLQGQVALQSTVPAGRAGSLNTASTTGANGTAGLVGYWSFNNQDMNWTSATAGTAKDRSGNNNTGTLINMNRATSPVQGKMGQGLKFDGVSNAINLGSNFAQYVQPTVAASSTNMQSFTLSVWAKRIKTSNTENIILGKVGSNGGILEGYFGVFGTDSSHGVAYSVPLNTWYQATMVYDNQTQIVKCYINSVLKSSINMAGLSFKANSSSLTVGARSDGGMWRFNGLIDEVRIYNRALTPAEVKQLYMTGR